jgi:4,5-dihydroxyphthalate decarboxylase
VRAYTVTTGVWVRGVLQNEYGVDLSRIRWVTDDEEHVEQYRPPANVEPAAEGADLVSLLNSGLIDAALTGNAGIGRTGKPRPGWAKTSGADADAVVQLFPQPGALESDWYLRTGIYPFHGLVAVRDDLLSAQPSLAAALFDAFMESKQRYLDRLRTVGPSGKEDATVLANAETVGGDPLPYGVEPNRKSIEALISFATQQQIISEPMTPESMFAEGGNWS